MAITNSNTERKSYMDVLGDIKEIIKTVDLRNPEAFFDWTVDQFAIQEESKNELLELQGYSYGLSWSPVLERIVVDNADAKPLLITAVRYSSPEAKKESPYTVLMRKAIRAARNDDDATLASTKAEYFKRLRKTMNDSLLRMIKAEAARQVKEANGESNKDLFGRPSDLRVDLLDVDEINAFIASPESQTYGRLYDSESAFQVAIDANFGHRYASTVVPIIKEDYERREEILDELAKSYEDDPLRVSEAVLGFNNLYSAAKSKYRDNLGISNGRVSGTMYIGRPQNFAIWSVMYEDESVHGYRYVCNGSYYNQDEIDFDPDTFKRQIASLSSEVDMIEAIASVVGVTTLYSLKDLHASRAMARLMHLA